MENNFNQRDFKQLKKDIRRILSEQVSLKVGNHVRTRMSNRTGSIILFQVLDGWVSSGRLLVLKLSVERAGNRVIVLGANIEYHSDNKHDNRIFNKAFDGTLAASLKNILPVVITFDRPSSR